MIAFLRGVVLEKKPGSVLVDTAGVGYRVRVSNYTLDKIPEQGNNCKLHIYHHITESDQQLFGFSGKEELYLFEMLITVKSIGPRLALALLSSMSPQQTVSAITSKNSALLAQSPGIGKKSAERIVLELNDKFSSLNLADNALLSTGSLQNEALYALEALGYSKSQAHKAIQTVLSEDKETLEVSDLIKKALKYLQR